MKKAMVFLNRYRFFFFFLAIDLVLLLVLPDIGAQSLEIAEDNVLGMLSLVPPIFILLGLMDVWVQRETMIKYMGEGSGMKGSALAFILGSAAAGPLYAAFPLAAVMMKKGAKLVNVFLFIGAWSTTKIPMLLFEASNLSVPYTLLRLSFNIIGIVVIAVILERSLTAEDKQAMYAQAKNL